MGRCFIDAWHAASGSTCHKGRTWRWDYSMQFGPLFVAKDGRTLKNQNPPAGVWKNFYAWLRRWEKSQGMRSWNQVAQFFCHET